MGQIIDAKEKTWFELFELGVTLKLIHGLLELASGFVVLFTSLNAIQRLFYWLVRSELLEDPRDRVVSYFAQALQHFTSGTKNFAALYLLVHGIINTILAISLYKKQLWAYVATVATLVVFIGYQIYRITLTHSVTLMALTVFDIAFVFLTWHEYQYQVRRAKR